MPLSDHVSLTISQDSVGIARAGFGVPLILSASAAWVERTRTYTSFAGVADDFALDSPEYLHARKIFSQSPHPATIMIGRCANKPTQRYVVTVAAVRNSHTYRVNVSGEGVTTTEVEYESDSAATEAEIVDGLVTALNAVVGNNYVAAFAPLVVADFTFTAEADDDKLTATAHGLETGDGPVRVSNSGGALPTGLLAATDYWVIKFDANNFYLATSLANALAGTQINLTDDGTGTHTLSDTASTARPSDPFTVTGDAAGDWFSLEVVDAADLAIAQNHADPGVAADIVAISNESDAWYALSTHFNSNAYVLAAAAQIEAMKKVYILDVAETDAITTAVGNSDTLDDLHTLGYARTMGAYHPDPAEFMAGAWMGRCLPLEPGSETWKFKTLSGVSPVTLTSTHRTNLINRAANFYQTVAGRDITAEGTTANGAGDNGYLDVIRGLDWLEDDMSKGVFGVLADNDKVPFTDAGVALIETEVRASLKRAVSRGILADDPAPEVNVPRVADVDASDKSARRLPDVKFSGTLAGAIHSVEITGSVSV